MSDYRRNQVPGGTFFFTPICAAVISGGRSYAQPVEIGAVIEGRVVGEVVRARDPAFREGDYVLGSSPLVKRGELKYREDVVDGLERAPEAFVGLLQGRNFGKLVVKLGDDPRRR